MNAARLVTIASAAIAVALSPLPASAAKKEAPKPAAAKAAPAVVPPRLIIMLSMDQFSADLFAEYRSHFTGGLKRLTEGAVFPSGFQSHAATETCPGHSTILTGSHPSRTGIIANNWVDLDAPRIDKKVYCAEDESVEGSSSGNYTASPKHLKVPTLGDWLKKDSPQSKVVSVSGKDRAAIMMAGHVPDEIWWWDGKRDFMSYKGRAMPRAVATGNEALEALMDAGRPAPELSGFCSLRAKPVEIHAPKDVTDPEVPMKTVGGALPAMEPGATGVYAASTSLDATTLDIATGLLRDMELGADDKPDVLIVGLSATDYVGHTYGTEGAEMCQHLMALDARLEEFFKAVDALNTPYVVGLTADHGGHDIPERNRERGFPSADRVGADVSPGKLDEQVREALNLEGFFITGDGAFGDYYIAKGLPKEQHDAIYAKAREILLRNSQVEAVFSAEEIAAAPKPTAPVTEWTLLQRAAASYDKDRSGDFYVVLKPYITPIHDGSGRYSATHGSIWDYDRRVPILFWWKGMQGFDQPNPVETVDILPTLASLIGLKIPQREIDGRCLDLVAGPQTNCP